LSEFRIKPQPKEWLSTSIKDNTIFNTQLKKPQYLYVYLDDNYELSTIPLNNPKWKYIGKIKLEAEDGN
jgi:hypothetical protein